MAPETASQAPRRKRPPGRPLLKALVWCASTTAALGVVGIFAGQIWLENHLKSEAFRQRAEKAVGKALNARAQISLPQRAGTSLYIDSLDARGVAQTGAPSTRFRELHAFGVRTELDLTALWRRLWKIESLSIQRMQCDLGSPSPEPREAPPSSVEGAAFPLLAKLLPKRSEILALRVERADLTREKNHLRQVRLHALPAGVSGEWLVTAEDGELLLGAFPDLAPVEVRSARVQIKRGTTILRDAQLLLRAGGQSTVHGEWRDGGTSEIRAKLEGVQIAPFLAQWWQTRLLGAVDGEVLLKTSDPGGTRMEANLSLKNGKLEALPVLSELNLFVGSPRFRSVPLRSASAKVVQTPDLTEFIGLKMDADGLLRIEGDVQIRGGQLEGLVQVGISAPLVQWLPGARSKVFAESRDGFLWTPMRIGGSPLQPVEDLSRRLTAAAAATAVETVTGLIVPGQRPAAPPDPKKPGEAVPESPLGAPVKKALEAVKSLLPGN